MAKEIAAKDKPKDAEKDKASEKARKKERTFYRVTVRDNGCGMPHDDIPQMLGRVLSGTKYTLKQARGRFGLGAKMTLIWAKMTTARPLEVYTARQDQRYITRCVLDIDIHKNEPSVQEHTKVRSQACGCSIVAHNSFYFRLPMTGKTDAFQPIGEALKSAS